MQLKKGDVVSCEIQREKVDRAEVQEEDGSLYLCQDIRDGKSCKNKLGYKYSWCINKGDDRDLSKNYITDIKFLPRTLDDLSKGDEVKNECSIIYRVEARVEDVAILSSHDRYYGTFLISELKNRGFSFVQPSPLKEEKIAFDGEEFITIDGKEYSKSTVKAALKEYCK